MIKNLSNLAQMSLKTGILACCLSGLAMAQQVALPGGFNSFDPPGSTGTIAQSNTLAGIAGEYYDATGIHGFVRSNRGVFTSFDVMLETPAKTTNPPADRDALLKLIHKPMLRAAATAALVTNPFDMNNSGAITGYYGGTDFYPHAFVRDPQGTIIFTEPPGAKQSIAVGINSAGDTVGVWADESGKSQGFIRSASGQYTFFKVPNSYTTVGFTINDSGAVAGNFTDASGQHSYIYSQGNYTIVDANPGFTTIIWHINASGATTGYWIDSSENPRGFVRAADGTTTLFDVPGARGTQPAVNNTQGDICGTYITPDGSAHGFIRSASGTITQFDYPGSIFTAVASMNNLKTVVGSYADTSGLLHGFSGRP